MGNWELGNWEWGIGKLGMGNWELGNWGIGNWEFGEWGLLIDANIQFPIPYAQFPMPNSYLALDSVRA